MNKNENKELYFNTLGEATELKRELRELEDKLREEYAELDGTSAAKKVFDDIWEVNTVRRELINATDEMISEYNSEEQNYLIEKISEVKTIVENNKVLLDEKELEEENIEEEIEEEKPLEETEVVEVKKGNKTSAWVLLGSVAAGFLGGLASGALLRGCSNERVNTSLVQEDEEETKEETKELKPGEPGTFLDANDENQVNERVNWYFENYFNKTLEGSNEVIRDSITKENLADAICVANGVVPNDASFNANEVINYNNKLVQMFINYQSDAEKTTTGKINFIPTQYIFSDGSYEQKCAAEVDAIMEPLIKAINEDNCEEYVKYATAFGELMRDQYYLPDNTTEHHCVRSVTSYPSRIQLYGLAYANYTANVYEEGLSDKLNICVPFCKDYNTNEVVNMPLSKLMTMLDFVPTSQWDAVIARSGMTVEEIKNLGNASVEDTMPVEFTKDAKNHFRELSYQPVLK